MNAKKLIQILVPVVLLAVVSVARSRDTRWTSAEIDELRTMTINSLDPLPSDPTNAVADNPRAAELGKRLFFDTRFSSNGHVSCATCHVADLDFQDGKPLATGVGVTTRRTMPIAGTAYSPFLFWDGRKDSQWAQALGPLESAVEHGGTRAQYAHLVREHYSAEYEALFGALPDISRTPRHAGPVADPVAAQAWRGLTGADRDSITQIFVNIGKAIAAYERRIQYGPSRFDAYVEELAQTGRATQNALTEDEIAGLRLFIGKGNCTQCHNGPLFTNYEFHNTGVPAVSSLPADRGRIAGATNVLADEFNCRSRWSDAPSRCSELEFMVVDAHHQERAFKVPSLRNVAGRAPYMHAGQLPTLADVLAHYNNAPASPSGHSELKPLKLNKRELSQIEAFLRTLGGAAMDKGEF